MKTFFLAALLLATPAMAADDLQEQLDQSQANVAGVTAARDQALSLLAEANQRITQLQAAAAQATAAAQIKAAKTKPAAGK
jgi:hypothetical protein